MPKQSSKGLRDDVTAMALRRKTSFAQIAKDFGNPDRCVQLRVKLAVLDGGRQPVVSTGEAV